MDKLVSGWFDRVPYLRVVVALVLFVIASIARFYTMNSNIDITTLFLVLITLFCGRVVSIVCWALFGVILEISYIMQTLTFSPIYFAISVLTCLSIGLLLTGFVSLVGYRSSLIIYPVLCGLVKWFLGLFQDVYLLIFNWSMLPIWWSYHLATELYVLSKMLDAVLFSIPMWLILLILEYVLSRRSNAANRKCLYK